MGGDSTVYLYREVHVKWTIDNTNMEESVILMVL